MPVTLTIPLTGTLANSEDEDEMPQICTICKAKMDLKTKNYNLLQYKQWTILA